jgi:AdoMet-dependent heme synthase
MRSMSLMERLNAKAGELGVPWSVQLDITWKCNERCVHCYVDSSHEAGGELTTGEIKNILKQLADAGTLFLTISGGEPLVRADCFEILAYARSQSFNIKLKTNGTMIGPGEAANLRRLGIEQIQISIYSHRDQVHDAITRLPGSLRKSLRAIRLLREHGLKVSITDVLMGQNFQDFPHVRALATELATSFTIDPTLTPGLDGDKSVLQHSISAEQFRELLISESIAGKLDEFCLVSPSLHDTTLDAFPCSAGHTACYISPCGEVLPCVQFPVVCGNLRERSFGAIWLGSAALKEIRSVLMRDLPTCSKCVHAASCTRCPGLAYMEGDLRGASAAGCARCFARTGIAPNS